MMSKLKDTLKKYKWWFCGLVVCSSGCLSLSQKSEFRGKELFSQSGIEKVVIDQQAEKNKLLGYSMIDAFKYGVVNSISDYAERSPHKVDTLNFAGDFGQEVTLGYYQKIAGNKEIHLTYINPDTLSIPGTSSRIKRMICSFADYHNKTEQMNSKKAHESGHQADDPDLSYRQQIKLNNISERSVYDYNVTAYQFGQICDHSEIKSRICELLYWREQYITTRNINAIDGFNFYKSAIRTGRINPLDQTPQEQERERFFIFKSVFDMYNDKYKTSYEDYAIEKMPEHKPYSTQKPNEYREALDNIYTFIWMNPDGKCRLVNMNYIAPQGEIEDIHLTDNVAKAAAEREHSEKISASKKGLAPTVQALSREYD